MLSRYPRPTFFVYAALVLVGLSGCSVSQQRVEPYPQHPPVEAQEPQAQAESASPTEVSGPVVSQDTQGAIAPAVDMLPLLRQVDDRIAVYEGKNSIWPGVKSAAEQISQDRELAERVSSCQARLQSLLADYNALHDMLVIASVEQGPAETIAEKLRKVTADDISFLESECEQFINAGKEGQTLFAGNAGKVVQEGERAIAAAMAAKDYQQVITLYEQLPVVEGIKPSFASVYSYGQSLLRSGREKEAGQILASLLQDIQQLGLVEREFQLMQMIADIRFGFEEYSTAFADYVNIINKYAGLGQNIDWARKQQMVISARTQQPEEVSGFAALLRAYLSFNQSRDGFKVVLLAEQFLAKYPDSVVTPTVNRILFESRDSAEAWYLSSLQQVNSLREAGNYGQGLELLHEIPFQELPMDKQSQLQAMLTEMEASRAQEAESQRAAEETGLQESWSKGMTHLQLKEYDAAIALFSGMLNTSFAEQARGRISEAANLAAQENRQKAAELFVQASSARDQATRVALLQQSRQLLQDILRKYPQSDLVDKARKNLERIEQDLRAIDPALLVMPEAGDVPAGSDPANPGTEGAMKSGSELNGPEIVAPAGTEATRAAETGDFSGSGQER